MKAISHSGRILNICSKFNLLSWNCSSSYCCQSAHSLSLETEVFHHSCFAVGALRQTSFTKPGKTSVQRLKQQFVKMSWSCNVNQMADMSWPFSDGAAKFLSVWNRRKYKMTPSLEGTVITLNARVVVRTTVWLWLVGVINLIFPFCSDLYAGGHIVVPASRCSVWC